jgi:hypothetical protein
MSAEHVRLVVFFVAVAVMIGLLAVALRALASMFMGASGGWAGLARRYAAPDDAGAPTMRGLTIAIGPMRWRNCVNASVDARGLRLSLPRVFIRLGKAPVLIPWREMSRPEPARLYGRAACLVRLGATREASITVPMDLYAAMSPFLPDPT